MPADAPGETTSWEDCPDALVRAALELLREALGASLCGLAWREPGGTACSLAAAGAEELGAAAAHWLAMAAERAPAPVLDAGDEVWIAPVHEAGGRCLGAIVVRPADGAGVRVHGLLDAASRQLLAARRHAQDQRARSTAYEALVEIGTQIQAEEVNADAVLRLIVDRSRELCGTDVAWLALVDDDGRRVRMAVASGTTSEAFLRMSVEVGQGIGGAAVASRRTIVVRDHALYGNGTPPAVRRALEDEHIVSVLCAPMLRGARMVGALYVGSRHHTPFDDHATALLTALASQAAITIENGRLYRALAAQNDTLERSAAIHRQLSDAALAGGGLDRIGRELAGLLGRDIVVEREIGPAEPLLYRPGTGGPERPSPDERTTGTRLAVTAGETRLGTLIAPGEASLSPLQRQAMEHGATVIALELVKERAELEVEWRLQGELLEELLRCGADPAPGLVSRAHHAGVDLSRPRRIAVVRADAEADQTYLMQAARLTRGPLETEPILVARSGGGIVIALPDEELDAARARVEAVCRKAERAGIECHAGISDSRTNLAAGLREAEAALALARGGGGRTPIVTCEQLGPLRFLLDAPTTTEMEAMVRRTLGPLAEHDRARGRAALLPTLRAFLEVDGHQATAAAACHIHVSTLKYRMSRIAAVLERSPQDPDTRFELRLAITVLDVLSSLGVDPFAGD